MQPPAPKPAFVSRALFRIRSELSSKARAPTDKRLYFRSPHILENRRGDEFRLHIQKPLKYVLPEGALLDGYTTQDAYLIMKAPAPGRGAYMKFVGYKDENDLQITHLCSFSSIALLNTNDFSMPDSKLRGYGFLPIAVLLASHIAKKHGITNLGIRSANHELDNHYLSCGFISVPGNPEGVLLFPLKTTNP